MTPGTTTGGFCIVRVWSRLALAGASAVVQSAKQENQAATTPAPVFGATKALKNPIVGAVFNATNPATMTKPGTPSTWTERNDTGYNSPTTGLEVATLDSVVSSSKAT